MKQIILTAILCTSLTINVMTFFERGIPDYKPVMTAENLAQNKNFQALVDHLNKLPVKAVK